MEQQKAKNISPNKGSFAGAEIRAFCHAVDRSNQVETYWSTCLDQSNPSQWLVSQHPTVCLDGITTNA